VPPAANAPWLARGRPCPEAPKWEPRRAPRRGTGRGGWQPGLVGSDAAAIAPKNGLSPQELRPASTAHSHSKPHIPVLAWHCFRSPPQSESQGKLFCSPCLLRLGLALPSPPLGGRPVFACLQLEIIRKILPGAFAEPQRTAPWLAAFGLPHRAACHRLFGGRRLVVGVDQRRGKRTLVDAGVIRSRRRN